MFGVAGLKPPSPLLRPTASLPGYALNPAPAAAGAGSAGAKAYGELLFAWYVLNAFRLVDRGAGDADADVGLERDCAS